MTTLHATTPLNVEASINAWFSTQVNAISRPSWLPSFTLILNVPETPIVTPGISLYHMPVNQRNLYQGGHVGEGRTGARAANLLDVSCWVSRKASVGGQENIWNAQLMVLRGMVQGVFAGKGSLQVSNYLSDPANPVAVAYKVDFGLLEGVSTQDDPNPDIMRARFLIRYDWTVRSVA